MGITVRYREVVSLFLSLSGAVSSGTCISLPRYVDPILLFQAADPRGTAEEKPPSDTSGLWCSHEHKPREPSGPRGDCGFLARFQGGRNSSTERGNHDGIYEVSKEAVAAKEVQLTATPYFTYLNLNPDKQPEPRLDPGFTFSSLNSSHIDLLNETWHFGGSEHSRRYLANMVQCFPSTCILDSNGHPISWIIMESLGTLRHGYTLPSHRRRGYSSMVQRAQARRVHAAGFPVYGLVALDNTPQQKLLVSLGFQRLSELCHYCIHSPASQ
ncbi:glycine N-acyltransferase-like protein 3 isoform X2 [Podarcis raffonei]|uniref:glycine N-acyltransferase-like protein 3 isoform X2 n=1 Tax=Podarcis raffonei TaxID=65483 RepID=UPI0023298330|nr:glycine N-acyltransferase-like protein 3 isoform X2 [Podarcis raffonei]